MCASMQSFHHRDLEIVIRSSLAAHRHGSRMHQCTYLHFNNLDKITFYNLDCAGARGSAGLPNILSNNF